MKVSKSCLTLNLPVDVGLGACRDTLLASDCAGLSAVVLIAPIILLTVGSLMAGLDIISCSIITKTYIYILDQS